MLLALLWRHHSVQVFLFLQALAITWAGLGMNTMTTICLELVTLTSLHMTMIARVALLSP
jgi:hypothetical protein